MQFRVRNSNKGTLLKKQTEVKGGPGMEHQDHRGQIVEVGGLKVYLGGAGYEPFMDLSGYDVVVPFLETGHRTLPRVLESAKAETIVLYPIPDFDGVPKDWRKFLDEMITELRLGKKLIAFCMGGHGRTGTFLASLIAILEPEVEDPIAAARTRYCDRAVETEEQTDAIFTLKRKRWLGKYNLHSLWQRLKDRFIFWRS